MARFEILLWLYGSEKFPGLSRNGPQASIRPVFNLVPRVLFLSLFLPVMLEKYLIPTAYLRRMEGNWTTASWVAAATFTPECILSFLSHWAIPFNIPPPPFPHHPPCGRGPWVFNPKEKEDQSADTKHPSEISQVFYSALGKKAFCAAPFRKKRQDQRMPTE